MINMDLKELRISKKITQQEAAHAIGVSLRTYKYYENDDSKKSNYKYQYFVDALNKQYLIDEEHGVLTVEDIKSIVASIFEDEDVEFCYLFGSYAKGTATDSSDVDLLISTSITGMHFYGLAEKLRQALRKKVDLLNLGQLMNNKELTHDILKYGRGR